jgi:hypothetical protein
LTYQTAWRMGRQPLRTSRLASSVTNENSPSN